MSGKVALLRRNMANSAVMRRPGAFVLRLLRFCLLCGLAFVVLYPMLSKVTSMFMSEIDLYNPVVKYIPFAPTMENIRTVLRETEYFRSVFNSTWLSLICAGLQVLSCALIGYGLANFKFPGRTLVLFAVIFTLVVPTQALSFSMYVYFRYLNPLYLFSLLGLSQVSLINTPVPILLLSATGLALRNGLYILLFRQFFRGVPVELSEAAEIDGAGVWRTCFQIIMPLAVPFAVSIFMLSFAWQFTDGVYTEWFLPDIAVAPNVVSNAAGILGSHNQHSRIALVYTNVGAVFICLPLVILYIFLQRFLIQGIERSGLVG